MIPTIAALGMMCAAAWTVRPASARSLALIPTATSLAMSPSAPTPDDLVTLTATVTTVASGSPAGTVTFTDGSTILGSAALRASGTNTSTATLQLTLTQGHHDLKATYPTRFDPVSRNTFTTSTSNMISVDVGSITPTIHPTDVALTAFPETVEIDQSATLTATVTVADGDPAVPTGNVEFYDNGNDLGGAPLDGSGVATLVASGFVAGANTITATYSGDSTHSGNTSPPVEVSGTAPPVIHPSTVTLTADPTAVQTGQTETFTAVVAAADGYSAVPTGSVQFYDNGVPIDGSVLLDGSGVAVLAWTGFGAGVHTITATYLGDATYRSANSAEVDVTATAPPIAVATSITSSISPNPVPEGGFATLTAHVEQVGTHLAPPQGSIVTFRNAANQSLIAQAALDANGNASVTTTGWQAGHYDITATFVGDLTDAPSSVGITADVRPVTVLTITAPSPTITYGATTPALPPTYSGFVNGETVSSLTAPATCTSAAPALPAAGTYATTCAGAVDIYYRFTYVPGTLTVQKAPLTVTPVDATIHAGDPIPTLDATLSDFVNGETLATSGVTGSPDCTTTATSSSPAGTYPITCTTGTLAAANYSFTFPTQGTLTVLRAIVPLTVTAPSPTIEYGMPVPATLVPTYDGFVDGDTAASLAVQPTCTATAANPVAAGTYPVVCSGGSDPSYTFTYVPGTLTVTKAPLTVTPVDATIHAGDPIPTLDATLSDFVNGETLATSGVTGSPDCTTTATSSSPAGTYPITCTTGTLAAANYSFTFPTQGTLTIVPVGLTPTTATAWIAGAFQVGKPVTLVGSLFRGWWPLAHETLTLSLGSATCQATTNVLGFTSCQVTPTGPLGPTTSTVAFAGDARYQASSDSRPALLYAFPTGGGAFVIGDGSALRGGTVTFWGSQWSKSNKLIGGSAPSSFKGWAPQPSTPTFGAQWSSGPGNNAQPPAAPLPSYMGVIVTSSARKSGSSITGTVVAIVVVKVDPGYSSDPGHAGTGTIVGLGF